MSHLQEFSFPASAPITDNEAAPTGDDGIPVDGLTGALVHLTPSTPPADTTIQVYGKLPDGSWVLFNRETETIDDANPDGYGPYDVRAFVRFASRLSSAGTPGTWAGNVVRRYAAWSQGDGGGAL